jgi:phage antirepressor YoqD-like protein
MENSIFSYNGNSITMRNENGNVYVNLTEVAKSFPDKNLSKIINSQEISDYISRLSTITNVILPDLLIVKNGGSNGEHGTWAHQKVALRVCQKLSTDFAIWIDSKIEELLTKGYTKVDTISRKELAKMLLESEEEKEQLLLIMESQAKELKESAPKVEYYDECLESKGYLTVNMVAAELGISSIKLNKLLCNWGIQYNQSGCYFLYSAYRDKGYTVHRPHPHINSNGITVTTQHMYWTEAGKKLIVERYRKNQA